MSRTIGLGADCNPAALDFEYPPGLHFRKMNMNILADLRANICDVTFTKANGSERVMRCTLKPEFLPQVDFEPVVSGRTVTDLVTVWSIDDDAWRSFKPSKLTDIKFIKE